MQVYLNGFVNKILQFGRSTGVGFGAASSSHYQQHQQHATSLNSTGVPFVPANYQDVHFHDPDVSSTFHLYVPYTLFLVKIFFSCGLTFHCFRCGA